MGQIKEYEMEHRMLGEGLAHGAFLVNEPIRSVDDLVVYQKSVKLFEDFIRHDMPVLRADAAGRMLYGNQLRCLDSVCANMEEGIERKRGKEAIHFFRIAKGSAGEARGRFSRLAFALPADTIRLRVALLSEIRAMLASLIQKWKD